jgi:RNA polymerase sigma-70 factor (ECF subfamily)
LPGFSDIKKLTDLELIAKYRESDNNLYVGELYRRYTHLVYGVCYKYLGNHHDCHDATVEIFEQLLLKLKVHDVLNFKAWLHSVAKNHCLMKLRKGKNQVVLTEDMNEVVESGQELHPSGVNDQEQKLRHLEEAVTRLNEEQRICIELFYLQQKSYQQIMKETGFDFRQVKSFIQNGKRNLKIALSILYERKTS